MDMIDRQAAINEMINKKSYADSTSTSYTNGWRDGMNFLLDELLQVVFELPSAEPEIVRCKDCRHRVDDDDFECGHICMLRRENGGRYCEDDDYCSYAERRTDDNE